MSYAYGHEVQHVVLLTLYRMSVCSEVCARKRRPDPPVSYAINTPTGCFLHVHPRRVRVPALGQLPGKQSLISTSCLLHSADRS